MPSIGQGVTNTTVVTKVTKVFKVIVARMYMNPYPWFCKPATVHKILVHSPDIISLAFYTHNKCRKSFEKHAIKTV
jgi:hypothetical protein